MITVVITGSCNGIGLGLSRAFLAAGCNVTVSCHDAEGLRAAETELNAAGFGERFLSVLCDVALVDEVEMLWQQSAARFGRVDIWINNAASAHRMVPLWKLEQEEMAGTVDVSFTGTLNGSYVAMRNMIVQGGGHIYNMDWLGPDGNIPEGLGFSAPQRLRSTIFPVPSLMMPAVLPLRSVRLFPVSSRLSFRPIR